MQYKEFMQELNCLNLNGRLLKLFLAVYDTNSVSVAAEQFELNQSTVSHSVEKLRTCLADPLFVKSGRGIVPTERAIMLAPHIRELVAKIEGLENSEDYSPQLDSRPVTITTNVVAMMPLFIGLRAKMAKAAANLPLRLLELGSRSNIEHTLETGRADLAISIRGSHYPKSLKTMKLFSDDLACFFDPKFRQPVRSVSDYASAKHGVVDFGAGRKSIVDVTLEGNSLARDVGLFAPNVEALAQLIKGTDLVATMPAKLQFSVFSSLAHCAPPVTFPNLHIDMIWHTRTDHSGRGTWIRDLVLSAIPDEVVIKDGQQLKHQRIAS